MIEVDATSAVVVATKEREGERVSTI